jgi:two-component system, NarL family, sensor kinase
VTAHVNRAATGTQDELVFTAAEELVANAARRASARSIELTLEAGAGQIELRVSDDGVGTEPAIRIDAEGQGPLGLAITAERLQAFGGRLDVRSVPRHGTTAIATLPAERPA